MKRVIFFTLLLVLALGCVALCGCGIFGHLTLDTAISKCDKTEELTITDGASITFDVDVYSVLVHNSTDGKAKLLWTSDEKFKVDVKQENGLVVTEKGTSTINLRKVNQVLCFVLLLPEEWTHCSISTTSTVGEVQIADLDFAKVECSITTGSVWVEDCTIEQEVVISSTTGGIKLDAEAPSARVTATTGSIEIEGKYETSVFAQATTGGIKLECECESITAEVTTGSIKLEVVAKQLVLKSTTGSIKGEIEGKKADYTITTSVSTGSTNLTNQTGASDCTLSATSGTGTINIKFKK